MSSCLAERASSLVESVAALRAASATGCWAQRAEAAGAAALAGGALGCPWPTEAGLVSSTLTLRWRKLVSALTS